MNSDLWGSLFIQVPFKAKTFLSHVAAPLSVYSRVHPYRSAVSRYSLTINRLEWPTRVIPFLWRLFLRPESSFRLNTPWMRLPKEPLLLVSKVRYDSRVARLYSRFFWFPPALRHCLSGSFIRTWIMFFRPFISTFDIYAYISMTNYRLYHL